MIYQHAFFGDEQSWGQWRIMNDIHGSSINSQLWKPSFLSKLRAAVKSYISQYLGWVYATQEGRSTVIEQAGHRMHHMHSPWAGKAQYRHSTGEEGEQLHDVSWTVAWLQQRAVINKHQQSLLCTAPTNAETCPWLFLACNTSAYS